MSDITWINVTVKLGDLKPWDANPRQSTKAQARRILKSFEQFGQVQAVAIGPALEVYDGHQRLSALLTIHGPDYEIDARQASRPLDDAERRAMVLALHAGAVGSWDWDAVSSWQPAELMEGGFDAELLREWKRDTSALTNFLGSEAEPDDPMKEWEGMPEFDNPAKAYKSIMVHFENKDNYLEFCELIKQALTEKSTSCWYPEKERRNMMELSFENQS